MCERYDVIGYVILNKTMVYRLILISVDVLSHTSSIKYGTPSTYLPTNAYLYDFVNL